MMKMQKTEMEFVTFDAQDVIATSGERTINISNFYDGKSDNGTIIGSDGTKIYDAYAGITSGYVERLRTFFGTKYIKDDILLESNDGFKKLNEVIMNDGEDDSDIKDAFNGVYKWVDIEFVRVNQ